MNPSTPHSPAPLVIHWRCFRPPVAAQSWIPWTHLPEPTDDELQLAKRLGWPSSTITALRAAFTARLSRYQGWQLPVDPMLADALSKAATVYRRGVCSSAQPEREPIQGQYAITFDQDPRTLVTERLAQGQLIIIDEALIRLWKLDPHQDMLALSLDETSKSLASVSRICEFIREQSQPTQTVSIIGGGVLSDTASFAAFLCSRRFELVPTTLLAMIDACVGGKTGVNFPPFGKNQIGAFAFPNRVSIAADWLETLPERELIAGKSEALKHCFLSGDLSQAHQIAQKQRPSELRSELPKLIKVKADVISQDPTEEGLRASLNLGHTLAHALEAFSQSKSNNYINHGEAVGLGLALALRLSVTEAGLDPEKEETMYQALQQAGCILPYKQLCSYLHGYELDSPELWQQLAPLIMQDKKNQSHESRWILLKAPGEIATDPSSTNPYTVRVVMDRVYQGLKDIAHRLRTTR